MHSEAYRKSIAVKRGSHNPHPAPSVSLQSSSLCFFLHSLSSPISLSSSVLSPFNVHFQPCPLLLYRHFAFFLSPTFSSQVFFSPSRSLLILTSNRCCACLVFLPLSKTCSLLLHLKSMAIFCSHWEGVVGVKIGIVSVVCKLRSFFTLLLLVTDC